MPKRQPLPVYFKAATSAHLPQSSNYVVDELYGKNDNHKQGNRAHDFAALFGEELRTQPVARNTKQPRHKRKHTSVCPFTKNTTADVAFVARLIALVVPAATLSVVRATPVSTNIKMVPVPGP